MLSFLSVIQALNAHKICYVLVGGLATVIHGHARLTLDVDLIVSLEERNAELAVKTLLDLGFVSRIPVNPLDFANESIRRKWLDEKGLTVFSLYHPHEPLLAIDLFVEYPIPFDELYRDSIVKPLGAVDCRVCSIDHLIAMKQIAGRPKDLEDIRILEIIKNEAKGN